MATCFVIQPFDSGKFDKRYDDVYEPAIRAAGLEPYRVDRDPGVVVAIEAIEDGIKNAAACLADITEDNPNVWYELGFAFASGRPVVMVCSNERTSAKFPFDIQHRTIILYRPEAPSDFAGLQSDITKKIHALLSKKEVLRQLSEAEQVAPTHGVGSSELIVLANLAGDSGFADSGIPAYNLRNDSERAGLTGIGFSLALRRLVTKQYAEVYDDSDFNGNDYKVVRLTDKGWNFIEQNETLFVLRKPEGGGKLRPSFDDMDDKIPF